MICLVLAITNNVNIINPETLVACHAHVSPLVSCLSLYNKGKNALPPQKEREASTDYHTLQCFLLCYSVLSVPTDDQIGSHSDS